MGAFKSSIGTDGRFCVCHQGSSETTFYEVESETLASKDALIQTKQETKANALSKEEIEAKEAADGNKVYYLRQQDFPTNSGTYRITQPGTYILQEDIEFEFNMPEDLSDPNAEGAWFPTADQADEYEGAGTHRDPYSHGFFAGFSIFFLVFLFVFLFYFLLFFATLFILT